MFNLNLNNTFLPKNTIQWNNIKIKTLEAIFCLITAGVLRLGG